jgi:hypothetical protein
LLEQEMVEGLEELPVTVILNRIASVFSSWEKVDENSWKNSNGKGAFQVKTTSQSILIDGIISFNFGRIQMSML